MLTKMYHHHPQAPHLPALLLPHPPLRLLPPLAVVPLAQVTPPTLVYNKLHRNNVVFIH
jgi:hypothetical protein